MGKSMEAIKKFHIAQDKFVFVWEKTLVHIVTDRRTLAAVSRLCQVLRCSITPTGLLLTLYPEACPKSCTLCIIDENYKFITNVLRLSNTKVRRRCISVYNLAPQDMMIQTTWVGVKPIVCIYSAIAAQSHAA